MEKGKFAVFGLVLASIVAVGVGSVVVAQGGAVERDRDRAERGRARAMVLHGRGAQIGVTVEDLTPADLKQASVENAVRIAEVNPDSPAANAGLREGDLVVEFEGDPVRSARQFARLVQETPFGHSVTLGILRDGQRQTLDVTPEAASFAFDFDFDPDRIGREVERSMREVGPRLRELEPRLREFRENAPFAFDFDFDVPWLTSPRARLGVRLQELTPQLAEYFGATDGGVLVSSVTPDSPAAEAGLKAGDVITTIDGNRIRDADDLVDQLREREGQVTVGILRDKKESSVTATLEERRPRRPVTRRPA